MATHISFPFALLSFFLAFLFFLVFAFLFTFLAFLTLATLNKPQAVLLTRHTHTHTQLQSLPSPQHLHSVLRGEKVMVSGERTWTTYWLNSLLKDGL